MGAAGAPGPTGPTGEIGARGATGPQGAPSIPTPTAIFTTVAADVTLTPGSIHQVAKLTLPEGSYLLQAQATAQNLDGAHDAPLLCYLDGPGITDGDPRIFGLWPQVSGLSMGASLSARTIAFSQVGKGAGDYVFECNDNATASDSGVFLHDIRFTAQQVTVNVQ